jgi:hypothetical protein
MKTTGQATDHTKQYINEIEKQLDLKQKYLRFDNGKGLVNKEVSRWAAEKGIVVQITNGPLLTFTTWNSPTDGQNALGIGPRDAHCRGIATIPVA